MIGALTTERKRFCAWLLAQGAEILAERGPWELLRFKSGKDIGIAWENSKNAGGVSAANDVAKTAWSAWKKGRPLVRNTGSKKPKRNKVANRDKVIKKLITRDGSTCWFCDCEFTKTNPITMEHLVPTSHGGINHISNLVLACEPCNNEAGHLSVAEKVAMREEKRSE